MMQAESVPTLVHTNLGSSSTRRMVVPCRGSCSTPAAVASASAADVAASTVADAAYGKGHP